MAYLPLRGCKTVPTGIDLPSLFVATLIATGGLWWFNKMLPSVRTMSAITRYGLYTLIWLAYFIAILMIIQKTGS